MEAGGRGISMVQRVPWTWVVLLCEPGDGRGFNFLDEG